MENNGDFSILFPCFEGTEYKQLSESACHDLGLDTLCRALTDDPKERSMIMRIISSMTPDPRVAQYRQEVFADILRLPDFRKRMTELFDKVEFIRTFGIMHKSSDEKLGLWHLMHRLDELDDYIKCVETMRECLSDAEITSQGLKDFRHNIDMLYNEACFAEMKQDIAQLKVKTADVQSVTLGINVNERFEAISMGLISVNDRPFKKSGIISNFADAISARDKIHKGTDWNGDMHYNLVESEKGGGALAFMERASEVSALQSNAFIDHKTKSTLVNMPEGDGINNSTFYLENVLNKMLDSLVKM